MSSLGWETLSLFLGFFEKYRRNDCKLYHLLCCRPLERAPTVKLDFSLCYQPSVPALPPRHLRPRFHLNLHGFLLKTPSHFSLFIDHLFMTLTSLFLMLSYYQCAGSILQYQVSKNKSVTIVAVKSSKMESSDISVMV